MADPRGTVSVTPARASTGTYWTGSTLASASSNAMRSEPSGVLVEGGTTNYVLQSGDLSNAAWTSLGTITTTANTCVGPTGATDLALLDDTAASGGSSNGRTQTLSLPSGTLFSASVWLSPQTGSHTGDFNLGTGATFSACSCRITCVDGSSPGCTTRAFDTLNCTAYATVTSLCKLTVTVTTSAATTSVFPTVSPGVLGVSNDKLCMGYVQVEPGHPTSYTATAGTSVARAADTAAVAASILSTTNGSGVLTVTPEWSSSTAGSDRPIIDTTGLQLLWVNASTAWRAIIGGQTVTSGAQAFAAGSSHTLRWRYSTSGLVCLSVNGTETCSGLAPSALVPSGSLYIGGNASGGGGVNVAGLRLCSFYGVCR